MSQRAMKYLNDNRIVYRKYSDDIPTKVFNWGWYYEDGTYGYYSLFNTKAKITSYKSLKWHLLVLWYLNPQLTMDEFKDLAEYISNKDKNFITFTVPDQILKNVIYEVYMEDLERPPKNKLRKIVFKDGSGLSVNEKLKIVGKIMGSGKSVNQDDIYDAMLMIHENEIITIAKIASVLKCTTRTIHRNMGEELRREKELLNRNYEKV